MNVYQIWFRIFVSVVSVTGLWIPSARAAEMLVSDPNTGCKVYIDSGERPGSGVKWHGACTADKYANGDGILFWTAGGKVYFIAYFRKRGGLIMENGHIRIEIPDDAMTPNVRSGGQKCYSARAVVKRDVDLAFNPVLSSLIDKLLEQYKSACPQEWAKNGSARLFFSYQGNENGQNDSENVGLIVNRDGARSNFGSGPLTRRNQVIMMTNQRRERTAAKNRAAQNRQRQEQFQRASDQKLQAFSNKYGALGWIKWETLLANPFSVEGKVYLFNSEFTRMITPTSGIFNNVVVSDVPRNAFTTPTKVMLAGKVLGTTNIKNQFGGEVSVPHVRYLGHIACRDPDCDGYFKGNLR